MIDEWVCRPADSFGRGPYSIERGTPAGGDHEVAASGIKSYPLACAAEGIVNGLDEFMDMTPDCGQRGNGDADEAVEIRGGKNA